VKTVAPSDVPARFNRPSEVRYQPEEPHALPALKVQAQQLSQRIRWVRRPLRWKRKIARTSLADSCLPLARREHCKKLL
jgi:hypothetical protein